MTENNEVRNLRQQIKDLESRLRESPTKEQVEADIRAEMQKEKLATVLLADRGQPAGLVPHFLDELGDGAVDDDAVEDFLTAKGFDTALVPQAPAPTPTVARPADPMDLSARVDAALSGAATASLTEQIHNAKDATELLRLTKQAGLGSDQY